MVPDWHYTKCLVNLWIDYNSDKMWPDVILASATRFDFVGISLLNLPSTSGTNYSFGAFSMLVG